MGYKTRFSNISLCRSRPKLTHLLFADDNLLFCRAATKECAAVLNTLETYEDASGQKVNRNKTTLFFSKSTSEVMRQAIKETLGVQEIHQYEKYLGLPSLVGRGKKESFNFLKERVWKKLQGWEGKLLSQAGREVLIKSVIQAIPTFTMGCFKLPLGLCNDIEMMIRKFWVGSTWKLKEDTLVEMGRDDKIKIGGRYGFSRFVNV